MNMKNDIAQLRELANLMNDQSQTPIMVTDDLLYVFDAALEPEEVDFLLKMGGGNLTRRQIELKVDLSKERFETILEPLLNKGHITELEPAPGDGEPIFHLMSIFPGWFELYLMRGSETPDRQEFSRRLSQFFSAAKAIPADLLNAVMQDTAPHRSIAAAGPSQHAVLTIDEEVQPPPAEIFPPHSVLGILEKLDDDEVVTVGRCFCRQQRKMDDDPCRMSLPEEACIGLGTAAEHLMKRGFARPISKAEAIKITKESAQKGAVHQVGRLIPLKDFKVKHEIDIICNCCWDCCGLIGNYSRGNIPFLLKSYYTAEIVDQEACTNCGVCEEYCPVRAFTVTAEGVPEINGHMCCGCGLCALHCPEQVIHLKALERNVFLPVLEGSSRRIA